MQAGLADCYDQGLVKAVGVSNYGPKQLRKIHKYLQGRGVPLAAAQVRCSDPPLPPPSPSWCCAGAATLAHRMRPMHMTGGSWPAASYLPCCMPCNVQHAALQHAPRARSTRHSRCTPCRALPPSTPTPPACLHARPQVQFSLLSYGPQQQVLLEVCQELGITVIAYSPLGLGMLTGASPGLGLRVQVG